MVEILLSQENKGNHIELINNINSLNDKSKLYKSVNSKEEIINILSNRSIDILVIEYDIFKTFNILEFAGIDKAIKYIIILNKKTVKNSEKYKEKYIFVTKELFLKTLEDVISLCDNEKIYTEETLDRKSVV